MRAIRGKKRETEWKKIKIQGKEETENLLIEY
jgi:hypothetical protein